MNDSERLFVGLVRDGVYDVRSDGSVWKMRPVRGTWSKRRYPRQIQARSGGGYVSVSFYAGGKSRSVLAHRVVYLCFKGDIPHGYTINHISGVKTDNRPENLEAVTYSENSRHAQNVLGKNRGETSSRALLSEGDVREIRRLYTGRRGEIKHLSEHYGVSRTTIALVVHGRSWSHVDEPTVIGGIATYEVSDGRRRGHDSHFAKLTDEDVIDIRRRYDGKRGRITELASVYGVSVATVSMILSRNTWKHVS